MELEKNIKEEYKKVFDENGQIMPCGRNKCISLIELMEKRFPNVDFGDSKTGFMKPEKIKLYMKKL